MKLKSFDYFLILIYLSAIVFSTKIAYAKVEDSAKIFVESKTKKWIYPIEAEENVKIPGLLGITEIEIKNNTTRVISSPCNNKLCISKGNIEHNGEWLACLPNGIFIKISGENKINSTDALSY